MLTQFNPLSHVPSDTLFGANLIFAVYNTGTVLGVLCHCMILFSCIRSCVPCFAIVLGYEIVFLRTMFLYADVCPSDSSLCMFLGHS